MSANDKSEATYGPGRTTPPLETRIAAVLSEHPEHHEAMLANLIAEAQAEALREAADDLASESPFHHYADTEAHWQIGGKWADRLRARADRLVKP